MAHSNMKDFAKKSTKLPVHESTQAYSTWDGRQIIFEEGIQPTERFAAVGNTKVVNGFAPL